MLRVGSRELTVLGEFKPFGLIAEALDGKPTADDVVVPDEYDYFLFDLETTRDRNENDGAFSDGCDHELFIRGNKITWSTGSRVFKKFTLPSPVIDVCWCRMSDVSEALLCILLADCLTIYNVSGEVVSVPLHCAICSIWPLPFGLLLQQAAEGSTPTQNPFLASSHSTSPRGIPYPRREFKHSPQQNVGSLGTPNNNLSKVGTAQMSSHLIIKDLLEEPQLIYTEDRGKMIMLKDFDEKTIWTSDQIPLMASYNKAKTQHSLWVAELVNSNLDGATAGMSNASPTEILAKQFSLRRIWQGKGAQTAAAKVFLATDDDATPIVCFLHHQQKKLLSVRLQTFEIDNEIIFDVKPDMSWCIPAIAAAAVAVTRPRLKVGLLAHVDIIVLDSENNLLLYSGKQCLCKFLLPSFRKSPGSYILETDDSTSHPHDSKILGLTDAIGSRVNLILKNGKILHCVLCRSPSSCLVNDCVAVMSEGLSSSFFNHFLALLWGDGDSDFVATCSSGLDLEWESLCHVIHQLFQKPSATNEKPSSSKQISSWDFLVNSEFHKNYNKPNFVCGVSYQTSPNVRGTDYGGSELAKQTSDKFYFELLLESLHSLHALYESLKLNSLRKKDLEILAVLLCDIAKFLGEENYVDHYFRDFPGLLKQFGTVKTTMSQKGPPNLFRWLENCLIHGCSTKMDDLPPLICKEVKSVVSWGQKIVSFYSLLCGAKQIGKKLSSGVYCNISMGSYCSNEELMVLAMIGERFGLQQLDSLPTGVSIPLRHALDKCRESPPTDWPAAAYVLLGREDMALSRLPCSEKVNGVYSEAADVNLISMSTPYMLHLHPVTVSSSVSDIIGLESTKSEDTDSGDVSMLDGMEHIFNSSTQLRYGRDLRLNEVRRLLCSADPVPIQTSINPSASEQDIQQAQLWQLAQRTTALPFGRGAFSLATISTLLTEAFAVPKLCLAGRLLAQQNATVNLDPNIRNMQELKAWPEFHNAVAAGLRLAPVQGKVSRTWIIYNKPEEPNATHAGLLLALGLHGYLRVLIIADIYIYLTQEHESTTVGLMLGLAASYRGTMQPEIAKSLFVHIPARHSSTFPELELPTLMQSAALVSFGLLHEASAHPPAMKILLDEIGRRSGGDNVLEREGYAVSAGFALGLVALGHGKVTLGSMETLVDRLFHYIGGKETHNERPLFLTPSTDEQNRSVGQVMDAVNVDVTAPGAIIALGLMFLKTECKAIMSKISVPQTHFDLQYVRPDFIMLRVIARNLIMWSRVYPSKDWVQSQIPEIIKSGIQVLKDDSDDIDDMDAETFVQAYVNVVAGACISLGLRFAGTKDGQAQELLHEYAVYFLNEIKPVSTTNENCFPKGLSKYVDRGTLEICLHLIVLSLSVVMAGSGHLKTFRLLRFLRGRHSGDGHANYGIQMAVSLAIGFLFLGGGKQTFSTSTSSVAALLITLYPRFPTGPNDNRCHLQAFRHLYVLATEPRWIQTIDVDSGVPVYAPIEITIRETEHFSETGYSEVTPCILPERAILKSVRVCGPRYWPQVIQLVPEDKPWWSVGDKTDPFNSGVVYIKRRIGSCSYVDDPIGRQSLLSRAMHKVCGLTSITGDGGPGCLEVDQLVSTFSSDPSLIAFAQLCCDPSRNSSSDVDLQEFCLQVLFEFISKDRPALLQVYLSLYTTIGSLTDQATNGSYTVGDSLAISSLKLALAYNEALLCGRLTTPRGAIIQQTFLGSLRKRVEEILSRSVELETDLHNYLSSGRWSIDVEKRSVLLSWYLQWYSVPTPSVVNKGIEKLVSRTLFLSSSVPFLKLLFPNTHINAICEIGKLFSGLNS